MKILSRDCICDLLFFFLLLEKEIIFVHANLTISTFMCWEKEKSYELIYYNK